MDWNNTSSFHQAMVDPDNLCDPQVIDNCTVSEQLSVKQYYYTVLLCADPVCRLYIPLPAF